MKMIKKKLSHLCRQVKQVNERYNHLWTIFQGSQIVDKGKFSFIEEFQLINAERVIKLEIMNRGSDQSKLR